MVGSWKSASKPDNEKCEDCSICLSPLFDDSNSDTIGIIIIIITIIIIIIITITINTIRCNDSALLASVSQAVYH